MDPSGTSRAFFVEKNTVSFDAIQIAIKRKKMPSNCEKQVERVV